jgi:hypothetical protein
MTIKSDFVSTMKVVINSFERDMRKFLIVGAKLDDFLGKKSLFSGKKYSITRQLFAKKSFSNVRGIFLSKRQNLVNLSNGREITISGIK